MKKVCFLLLLFFCFSYRHIHVFAQQNDTLEFTFDVNSSSTILPKIYKPNIDLSGRGFDSEKTWPQHLASAQVLDIWKKDIGFPGIYRLQFNLWDINELAKDKDAQQRLLFNYENVIREINAGGGIVILNIFGTPAGLGKVLDQKSFPWDLSAFKELVKGYIRELSCNKKLNIWYEAWSAPDSDLFFVGRTPEYLNLYKAIAEGVKELETETGINIPLGGPSASWWFQSAESNTIITPEKSVIYELIRFCSQNKLPLDFISWHAYSSDPKAEKEKTPYGHIASYLIREWLSYFQMDKNTPLVIDEWNYDKGSNVLEERREKSHISATYIFSRLKNMQEAGIDYQVFFSLEDFYNMQKGVIRNVGVFLYEQQDNEEKAAPKLIYNIFKVLKNLGSQVYTPAVKKESEFVGIIFTRNSDNNYTIVAYNYIDPEVMRNYLSRNVSTLNEQERNSLVGIIKSDRLPKISSKEIAISSLEVESKVKVMLNTALELHERYQKFITADRDVKISIKNLKGKFKYLKYVLDSSCSLDCGFTFNEEKEIDAGQLYEEVLSLKPYSLNMIVLEKKPAEPLVSAVSLAENQTSEAGIKNITTTELANISVEANQTVLPENITAGAAVNNTVNLTNQTQ
ncbi:MAG: hypothetical protein V1490_00700 [Candidatus Omnitrophota bacterium]